jgi:hypothetical protein
MYDQSPPMIVCILLIAANQRHAMGPWRNRTLNHVKRDEVHTKQEDQGTSCAGAPLRRVRLDV